MPFGYFSTNTTIQEKWGNWYDSTKSSTTKSTSEPLSKKSRDRNNLQKIRQQLKQL